MFVCVKAFYLVSQSLPFGMGRSVNETKLYTNTTLKHYLTFERLCLSRIRDISIGSGGCIHYKRSNHLCAFGLLTQCLFTTNSLITPLSIGRKLTLASNGTNQSSTHRLLFSLCMK